MNLNTKQILNPIISNPWQILTLDISPDTSSKAILIGKSWTNGKPIRTLDMEKGLDEEFCYSNLHEM